MTTFTKEQLQQIEAAAKEALWPVVWSEKKARAHFSKKITPEVVLELARIALQSLEREQIRHEHAEWSAATFGNVGPVGPLKHLSKEALEAAADPDDLLEWADMQFLLWDAQRRMGIPDDFITIAMIEKLEINKKRQWPKPKDGEPRLHIKTQSAQESEYQIYLGCADDGKGCEIMTGKPLKTYDEWLNS